MLHLDEKPRLLSASPSRSASSSTPTMPTIMPPSSDKIPISPSPYLPTPTTSRFRSISPGYLVTPTSSRAPSPYLTASSTPRPTLLFALASDDPHRVSRALLPDGDDDDDVPTANDTVPTEDGFDTCALDYTLQSSDRLVHWRSIVAVLLGFGASPPDPEDDLDEYDIVLRYNLHLAAQEETVAMLELIRKSKSFAALGRLRFEMIGQQRVLEGLFKGLRRWEITRERARVQKKQHNPVVIMLCGLSAHGKTMMAQKSKQQNPACSLLMLMYIFSGRSS